MTPDFDQLGSLVFAYAMDFAGAVLIAVALALMGLTLL